MTDSSFEDVVKSFEDGESYKLFSKVLVGFLVTCNSYQELKDYWQGNINMIDGAKKLAPDIYNEIRRAFANRRAELEKQNG